MIREAVPSDLDVMLSGVLECIKLDLLKNVKRLPDAQFIIANLLIEYIGYAAFAKVVRQVEPEYCILRNSD